MKYLLDTDVCIHILRGNQALKNWLEKTDPDDLAISEITVAELLTGAEIAAKRGLNPKIRRLLEFIDSFNIIGISQALHLFAKEKARLYSEGKPIEDFDLLIACCAISSELTLITGNIRHMDRVNGLELKTVFELQNMKFYY